MSQEKNAQSAFSSTKHDSDISQRFVLIWRFMNYIKDVTRTLLLSISNLFHVSKQQVALFLTRCMHEAK